MCCGCTASLYYAVATGCTTISSSHGRITTPRNHPTSCTSCNHTTIIICSHNILCLYNFGSRDHHPLTTSTITSPPLLAQLHRGHLTSSAHVITSPPAPLPVVTSPPLLIHICNFLSLHGLHLHSHHLSLSHHLLWSHYFPLLHSLTVISCHVLYHFLWLPCCHTITSCPHIVCCGHTTSHGHTLTLLLWSHHLPQ